MSNGNPDTFDRIHGMFDDIPDTRMTRVSPVQQSMPFVGNVVQYTVQTMIHPEEGFVVFLTRGDAEGFLRLVLPNDVCERIYRQRKALVDRSTPLRRERKRRSREAKTRREAKR